MFCLFCCSYSHQLGRLVRASWGGVAAARRPGWRGTRKLAHLRPPLLEAAKLSPTTHPPTPLQVGDMITEEALPTYMAMLNTLDGAHTGLPGPARGCRLLLGFPPCQAGVLLPYCWAWRLCSCPNCPPH